MTIEVERHDGSDEEWNRLVDRSPHAGTFHRSEALAVLATHADATLYRYVGYKGQEPVAIFPVFAIERGPITAAFSPPPRQMVPYLGPALLNQDKLKQRKAERRHHRFVEACLERVEEDLTPRYVKVKTDPAYDDLRPFKWNDCDVEPWYTYVLDITAEPETLLERFSSDARRNLRDGEGVEYVIEEGGRGATRAILKQVRERYEAQDRPYGLGPQFGVDLYDALPARRIRPYVCRVEGAFAGGILAVADGERVLRWQGGVRPNVDVDLAINDHLDWQVMQDAMAEGREQYDLVGAGVPRINKYKAKFNPSVRTPHVVEGGSWPFTTVVDLYRRVA